MNVRGKIMYLLRINVLVSLLLTLFVYPPIKGGVLLSIQGFIGIVPMVLIFMVQGTEEDLTMSVLLPVNFIFWLLLIGFMQYVYVFRRESPGDSPTDKDSGEGEHDE